MTRYAIIGTGVASMAAAEAIRGADGDGEIIIFGDDPHGYYSRPGLAYYLTGELTSSLLNPYPPQAYARLRARFMHARVTRVRASEHLLEIGDLHQAYDRLLIATGASSIPLNVRGAHLNGVHKLDHMQDANTIVKLARRSRAAVVVGGGITALELVEGLNARGVKVHYLLRGNRYWGNVLDEVESKIVERRLRQEGVTLHFNTELTEIIEKKAFLGRTGTIGAAQTRGAGTLKCDVLAYAIGVAPRIALAKDCGIRCDKGVLADEYLRTNLPDIFAAGDAAQVADPETGKTVIDSLWSAAREQGTVAGLNMTGQQVRYAKRIPLNVTRLAGLTTTILGMVGTGRDDDVRGIARGDSETWRRTPEAFAAQAVFDVNRLRVMVGERTIVGAVIMGDQSLSPVIEKLVRERVDVTSIHEALLEPGTNVGAILTTFWTEWKRQHAS